MRFRAGFVITGLLMILTVGSAQAAPINLVFQPFPHIFSSSINVTYIPGTTALSAIGTPLKFNDGTGPVDFAAGGVFDISATISNLGVPTSGTLTISGTVGGFGPGNLLTGNLVAFGFLDSPGGDMFEFLFDVTGGALASLYGPWAGVMLDANFDPSSPDRFTGNFAVAFNNPNLAGVSDTKPDPIPEPPTILLTVGGLGSLWALRRLLRVQ